MLKNIFYDALKPLLARLSKKLSSFGIKPLHLTMLGVVVTLVGSIFYGNGHFVIGSCIILIAGTCDMLDGAMARETKSESRFGAFIDSVTDRYSDFFILGGLIIHFSRVWEIDHVFLVLVVMLGSILTSYTKARSESLIEDCRVGLVERPERIVIICLSAIFGFLIPALWFLAVATNVTALQRIYHTWKQLEARHGSSLDSTRDFGN